jgi:cell division protein FtsB
METKKYPTRRGRRVKSIEEYEDKIAKLEKENAIFKEENEKLISSIAFIVKELIREKNELIEKMNYILILDRNDFESKG